MGRVEAVTKKSRPGGCGSAALFVNVRPLLLIMVVLPNGRDTTFLAPSYDHCCHYFGWLLIVVYTTASVVISIEHFHNLRYCPTRQARKGSASAPPTNRKLVGATPPGQAFREQPHPHSSRANRYCKHHQLDCYEDGARTFFLRNSTKESTSSSTATRSPETVTSPSPSRRPSPSLSSPSSPPPPLLSSLPSTSSLSPLPLPFAAVIPWGTLYSFVSPLSSPGVHVEELGDGEIDDFGGGGGVRAGQIARAAMVLQPNTPPRLLLGSDKTR